MGFLASIQMKGLITMKVMHNSIDINHYNGYILRIDGNQAKSMIRTTPNSQRCLNALAIDNPLEYARLALNGEIQMWVDAEERVWKCFNAWILSRQTQGSPYLNQIYHSCFNYLLFYNMKFIFFHKINKDIVVILNYC